MSRKNIIRAWKDPEYRASLSAAERAMLPENPAGLVEMTDAEMDSLDGGSFSRFLCNTDNMWKAVTGHAPPASAELVKPTAIAYFAG